MVLQAGRDGVDVYAVARLPEGREGQHASELWNFDPGLNFFYGTGWNYRIDLRGVYRGGDLFYLFQPVEGDVAHGSPDAG